MQTTTKICDTFDEAVDEGLLLEDRDKGVNTFILLAPKSSKESFTKCIINSTIGVIRPSNNNKWILIWNYDNN